MPTIVTITSSCGALVRLRAAASAGVLVAAARAIASAQATRP